MSERSSDDDIYDGMVRTKIPRETLEKVSRLINEWAKVTDKQKATVQVTFLACLQIIKVAGPAWRRIAIATLSQEDEP
jgi:hypothetical protein